MRTPDEFFAQPSNDLMQALSARLGLSSTNPVAEGIAAYSKLEETLAGLLGPFVALEDWRSAFEEGADQVKAVINFSA